MTYLQNGHISQQYVANFPTISTIVGSRGTAFPVIY